MPEPKPMICLDGVEKVYRTERIETLALSNVHMRVNEGEFLSYARRSGAAIGGWQPPGQITVQKRLSTTIQTGTLWLLWCQ
jgi:hypothetical protein